MCLWRVAATESLDQAMPRASDIDADMTRGEHIEVK